MGTYKNKISDKIFITTNKLYKSKITIIMMYGDILLTV